MADISNYLSLSTVTPAASFFEQCRGESNAVSRQEIATTRTFGLSWIDFQSNDVVSTGAEVLTGALFAQWAEYDKEVQQPHPVRHDSVEAKAHALAAKFSKMFGMTATRVVEEAMLQIREELGQDPRKFMRKSLNDTWVQSSHMNSDERIRTAMGMIDRLVGSAQDMSTAAKAKSLSAMLDRQLVSNGKNAVRTARLAGKIGRHSDAPSGRSQARLRVADSPLRAARAVRKRPARPVENRHRPACIKSAGTRVGLHVGSNGTDPDRRELESVSRPF